MKNTPTIRCTFKMPHSSNDEPAIVTPTGTQEWYKQGLLHRTSGPAIVKKDGSQCWYINDLKITSNKQFQEEAGLSDEEMFLIIMKYGDIK